MVVELPQVAEDGHIDSGAEDVLELGHRGDLLFEQELTQPMGVMHGGALASVADSAVAIALWGLVGMDKIFTTIEMKINFIGPVGSGEVIAEGKIIHCGRMTAVGDVVIKDQDDRLVGKCVATYMIIPVDENNPRSPVWSNPGEEESEQESG